MPSSIGVMNIIFNKSRCGDLRKETFPVIPPLPGHPTLGLGLGRGPCCRMVSYLNTFDLESWLSVNLQAKSSIALRMPFTPALSGWWWLYWRFYDTRIPIGEIDKFLGKGARKARWLLKALEMMNFATRQGDTIELTEPGAFWVHLAQNYFSLNYVNTIWTKTRLTPWPESIRI